MTHWVLLLLSVSAFADPECEKRIKGTGMTFYPTDPQAVCNENPNKEIQDCMVDILTRAKGHLRNSDFSDVYATCKADTSKTVRDCVAKAMHRPFNDAGYKPLELVAERCLLSRKTEDLSRKGAK